MEEIEELIKVGEKLGYKAEALQKFVAAEQAKREKKVADDLARQERLDERKFQAELREKELQEAQAQRLQRDKEMQHEKEMLEKQIALQQGKAGQDESQTGTPLMHIPKVKLPPLQDTDNVDAYISRFECLAISNKWPKAEWACQFSALLKGKALQVYARMPSEDVSDYDKIILALQKRFQLTEQGYKMKFRTSRPERGETPTQFVAQLSEYFHRWIELSKINKDYKELVDLLLREQFIVSCSMELSTYLKEHRCSSIDHMAELAEAYTEAHGLQSFTSGERRNPRLSRNEKPPDRNNKWYHCDDKHITETNLLTSSNNVYLMFCAKEVDYGT